MRVGAVVGGLELVVPAGCWIIAVNTTKVKCGATEAATLAESIADLATMMTIEAPDLEDSLVATEHECDTEYKRAVEAKLGEQEDTSWQEKHSKFIRAKGLSPEVWELPQEHARSPWVANVMGRRERQCLAYALKVTPGLTSVDVNQYIHRLFMGTEGVVGPLLPAGKVYMVEAERLLHGKEFMRLQSYPTTLIDNNAAGEQAGSKFLADIGGNMFTGTVYMALLLAAFAKLPPLLAPTPESEASVSGSDLAELARF